MKKHWAGPLIGMPWKPGADGPDAYNCWNLVRRCNRERFGDDMPQIRVDEVGEMGESVNTVAIKKAAAQCGWRPVTGEPRADDIVVMRTLDARRHVGFMVQTRRGLLLLHADGHMTNKGPVGAVVAQPLKDVLATGCTDVELWRRA